MPAQTICFQTVPGQVLCKAPLKGGCQPKADWGSKSQYINTRFTGPLTPPVFASLKPPPLSGEAMAL